MARTVQGRGVDLAVDERGTGRPVLWGHGLTSSRAQEDLIGIFALGVPEDRFRVVRYDARGHGESDGTADPADYTYPSLSLDQQALIEALGLDRLVLAGASMGVATALHTALVLDDRVEAMVLTVPPTAWATRPAQGAHYTALAEAFETGGLDALVAESGAGDLPPMLAPFVPDPAEAARLRYGSIDPGVLPALLRGMGSSDLPPLADLAAIDASTLIRTWADDDTHPVATAEALHETLPHTELVVAESIDDVLGWPEQAGRFLEAAVPH